MILSVHQPQYMPWLGFLDKIARSDAFVILDLVQYKPREFQNRNKIRTSRGPIWLSVPAVTKGLGRQKIFEVKIDNSENWQDKHWQGICSCYSRAPFFKEHCGFFEDVYAKPWGKLLDLNVHIMKYLLQAFEINTALYFESSVGTTSASTERIIELCKKMKADVYLSGAGGKVYLKESRFVEEGIKLEYQAFNHPVYGQLFAKSPDDFIPYMSAIDLLFNAGPKSGAILKGGINP